jgi:hypothetical protein
MTCAWAKRKTTEFGALCAAALPAWMRFGQRKQTCRLSMESNLVQPSRRQQLKTTGKLDQKIKACKEMKTTTHWLHSYKYSTFQYFNSSNKKFNTSQEKKKDFNKRSTPVLMFRMFMCKLYCLSFIELVEIKYLGVK